VAKKQNMGEHTRDECWRAKIVIALQGDASGDSFQLEKASKQKKKKKRRISLENVDGEW